MSPQPQIRFVLREDAKEYKVQSVLDQPPLLYDYFENVIKKDSSFEENKEHVVVICLNSRLESIGYNVVSVGTVNEATAHPREILRPVIVAGAYAFVLLHNHPSGDPSPSRADNTVTKRIDEAAKLMQIPFIDHVICGSKAPGRAPFYSFREAGLI